MSGRKTDFLSLNSKDLPSAELEKIVRAALAEDWGARGDITSRAAVDPASSRAARLVSRAGGVVCGLECARLAFFLSDPALVFKAEKKDGDAVRPGDAVARVSGPVPGLLKAERVALNFMTHLSGVASLTRKFVDAVAGTGAVIVCTRKTLPGLRALQKYAVRMGGGLNHRFTLDQSVLIKDNHIAASGGIAQAVAKVRGLPGYAGRVEVECDTRAQVEEALSAKADIIMLDNFSPDEVRAAAALAAGRAVIEVSGGVTLSNVRAHAEAGAEMIAVGALTHSAPSLDLGLDF